MMRMVRVISGCHAEPADSTIGKILQQLLVRDSADLFWNQISRNSTIGTRTIIIITRPKPAYGRQGLAGLWGQDTDELSTFLVFLTSHFAPAALSSDLNQPETINDDKNTPGIIKPDLEP